MATPRPFKNTLLAIFSLFFYFWGEVTYTWVFLLSVVFNYLAGILIGNAQDKTRSMLLFFAGAVNLCLLAYFKYANFIVENLNVLLVRLGHPVMSVEPVHLPIGISFITFHALSYLIDIKRGTSTKQKNPMDVLLYLALFPQLIAGPIIRYNQIAGQIDSRTSSIAGVYCGLRRFGFGLAKKVLIANQLGVIADQIFAARPETLSISLAWLGVGAYSLQLYFDFSGYSCMAIGLAMMFGFHFPENFNYPYISRSIQEFWRRWHISLSSWFRDYLYIPLGGNRVGPVRTYFNLVLVFFLCGLWHGASWNFVIWGLFHGCFLVLERAFLARQLERMWTPLSHGYTILVFMVAWVFFRANDVPHALLFLAAMFGFGSDLPTGYNVAYFLTPDITVVFVIALFLAAPVWPSLDAMIQTKIKHSRALVAAPLQLLDGVWMMALFGVCLLYLNESSYNPFIYFRF
ncbi:MAG TPA: MBOAT family protein [Pseudomonadales bacterium]|nr:MBOAT family protein [Pseudomonadales bacterium]